MQCWGKCFVRAVSGVSSCLVVIRKLGRYEIYWYRRSRLNQKSFEGLAFC
jgi:hypothetical protein